MGKPIMIDSDVLRYLVQEHLALQTEVENAAKATIISCEYCIHSCSQPEGCTEMCAGCELHDECACFGCGSRAENFEWRGIVEANEPTEEEIMEFVEKLTEKGGTADE